MTHTVSSAVLFQGPNSLHLQMLNVQELVSFHGIGKHVVGRLGKIMNLIWKFSQRRSQINKYC